MDCFSQNAMVCAAYEQELSARVDGHQTTLGGAFCSSEVYQMHFTVFMAGHKSGLTYSDHKTDPLPRNQGFIIPLRISIRRNRMLVLVSDGISVLEASLLSNDK